MKKLRTAKYVQHLNVQKKTKNKKGGGCILKNKAVTGKEIPKPLTKLTCYEKIEETL